MSGQPGYWNSLSTRPIDASVIDPNDQRGYKNAYLAGIRDREIISALGGRGDGRCVLDLGCGTGSLSRALVAAGWLVCGLDISMGLLRRTPERRLGEQAVFACYNGESFPLIDASVDAACTYVVLNHILEPDHLGRVLGECRRVLKPDGIMVCIEQVRRKPLLDRKGWKFQRTLPGFLEAFSGAGLSVLSSQVIRYGRFPSTPLVGLGLTPSACLPVLAGLERSVGAILGPPPFGYCDILFAVRRDP